jgi:hypothetical protein
MKNEPKMMQIVARYEASKNALFSICANCKHDGKGCELKGLHVDAATECFMFGKKDEKKGGNK